MNDMRDHSHILIVDDEPVIRALLREGLEEEGFRTSEAASRESLYAALRKGDISLITLDIGLGKADGLELALEVRRTLNVPIVMISGRSDPSERVRGLEHGADDYIVKPFHMAEVVLRVRNILRRYSGVTDALTNLTQRPRGQYRFPNGILDTQKRELRDYRGHPLALTDTEFQILELFVQYPNRILSRDEIMRRLRGRDWTPEERVLDGHIARLRRKLAPLPGTPQLIKSVRGIGYVFIGDVIAG